MVPRILEFPSRSAMRRGLRFCVYTPAQAVDRTRLPISSGSIIPCGRWSSPSVKVTNLKLTNDVITSPRGSGLTDVNLPLVSLRDVSLGYDSAPIAERVNLAIYPSRLIGLAGANGSGKTTLFRTILGLLSPLSGDLSRVCPLSNFGYVPQSAALDPNFPLSVREIVEMGAYGRVGSYQVLPSEEKRKTGEVLDQVGMRHLLTKSFFALSGGQ